MKTYCSATEPPHMVEVKPREKGSMRYDPRDLICSEHGRPLKTKGELKPRKPLSRVSEGKPDTRKYAQQNARRPMKRSQPERFWDDAREKVDEEGCCRICKRTDRKLEAGHVLGREHDEPRVGANGQPLKELYVDPDRIFPACGPFPDGCHGDVDLKRVNYLPYLTIREQVKAVEDAGGIAQARRLLEPVAIRQEVERSAA